MIQMTMMERGMNEIHQSNNRNNKNDDEINETKQNDDD